VRIKVGQGRLVSQNPEGIVRQYDRGDKGGLSFVDGLRAIFATHLLGDLVRSAPDASTDSSAPQYGWSAAIFAWIASYVLIWPKVRFLLPVASAIGPQRRMA
jgi:hypothetical protein